MSLEKLKLKAISGSDLDMISALAQDSILLKSTIELTEDSFHFLIDRFCWEGLYDGVETKKYRIHSSIHFKGVTKVTYNKVFQDHPNSKFLSLLAIHSDFANGITLVFANNSIISLTVNKIEVYLRDLYTHWPTEVIPAHNI